MHQYNLINVQSCMNRLDQYLLDNNTDNELVVCWHSVTILFFFGRIFVISGLNDEVCLL